MSDHRITDIPIPGNSRDVTTGVPPTVPGANWPSDTVPLPKRPSAVWLCVRVATTAAAAAVFVYACWLMSGSLDLKLRTLSGPLLLFRSEAILDQVSVFPMLAVWLPSIFAVGVWRNAATIMLSILALLCWVAFGFLLDAMSA
jgi:hypothetical protein